MDQTSPEHPENSPEQWVDRYGDRLYGYALYRVGDRALAEELVQETLVSALQSRDSFEGKSSFSTWLFSILRHRILDHLRKKYREFSSDDLDEELISGEVFDERGHWLVKPGRWLERPDRKFQRSEFMKIFSLCLERLPQRQAEVFGLREIDHHGSKEICKVLGISSTNYWVLMHRARLALRRCLEHEWFGGKGKQ